MTHALGAVALLAAAAPAKKSSGSPFLLILVVIGAAFYFFIYRPQQRKQKAAQAQGKSYEVGDEVVTAGGIVGTVLDITDDRVTLETSVGASFTVLRPYVLRKLDPAEPPADVVGDADEEGSERPEPPPPPRPEPPTDAPPHLDPPADSPPRPGTSGDSRPGGEPEDDDSGTDTGGASGPPII
jgi:preprotein translocase subunit YajC